MDISEIGLNAGKIWNYLSKKNDYVDVIELKFELNITNTSLFLAIGWLAREEKILILQEGNKLKIKLR